MKKALAFVKAMTVGGFRALDKIVWGTSVGRAVILSVLLTAGVPMTAATIGAQVINEALDEATPGA